MRSTGIDKTRRPPRRKRGCVSILLYRRRKNGIKKAAPRAAGIQYATKGGLPLNVIFYEKEDGTVPARDFIFSLDDKLKAKVLYVIDNLEARGSQLRMPYSEELTDGIFELRAISGSNIARVLYFFIVGNTAVLTNGFVKKTQKTPPNQIQLAKKYRTDYQRRNPS